MEPAAIDAPDAGEAIADVGGVVSVLADAATTGACSVDGCEPMSASMFTVACCMSRSGVADPKSLSVSWCTSRPHTHCTVPALKTSAPLEWREGARLWGAGWGGCRRPESHAGTGARAAVGG